MTAAFAFPALAGDPFRGYTLRVHESLAPARDAWRQALRDGRGYVFQTWEWNDTWQNTIGRAQGVQPRIVDLRDAAGRTVALWPLAIYCRSRLRVLDFLGDVVTDYRAPVLAPDVVAAWPAGAFEALWRAIVRSIRGVDLVTLRRMPARLEGPGDIVNPMTTLAGAIHAENAYAARLPSDMDAFRKRLSSKKLGDMRRLLRQLEAQAPVHFTPVVDAALRPAVLQALAEQKSRRWRESGSRDLFGEPGYLDFYRTLSFDPDTGADVVLNGMQAGDVVVAAHWGASYRGRYYWILPTYAAGDWMRYSCGRALMGAMIEWSIAHGYQVFDLTVGEEAYKKDWADHSLALYEWSYAVTLAGRVFLATSEAKAWARRQAWLRRLVRRAKGLPPIPAATH
ncbi:GNAT family N-acetyltransferase [Bordetella genomosp. 13]|uniref:GNAT family N-acetyltransferase n=1 Tax=Bordetella genomosp. 13 TaxID=463040 RepID=UPI0011A64624|nr:GNAT family N-acetyltransferase [Bordetella genomosp. 13]